MGNLTENFDAEEFACKHCGKMGISQKLVEMLQDLREFINEPIKIVSGYRCPEHNKAIGGGPEHPAGEAVDIACPSSKYRFKVIHEAILLGFRRIGIGSNFIHLGISKTLPTGVCWTY